MNANIFLKKFFTLSIDVSAAREYCKAGDNTLAAEVSFSLSGDTLTVSDDTDYASSGSTGDSAGVMNVTVFDNFGHKYETQSQGGADVVIDLTDPAGYEGIPALNKAEGLSIIVTIVSTLGKVKDGSVKDTFATSGNLTMEI